MLERIEINLLPADYRIKSNVLKIRREIIYPLLIDFILVTVMMLFMIKLKADATNYKNMIATVEASIKDNEHVRKEIQSMREKKERVRNKIAVLEKITVNREKWVRLLETFSGALPDKCWLTSVTQLPNDAAVIEVKGHSLSFPGIAHYMTKLENSGYISQVDLKSIENRGNETGLFLFILMCRTENNTVVKNNK